MQPQYIESRDEATLRVTRPMLYGLTMGFMALVGTVFWSAGYAAGVHGAALLGTLFAMGASAALLVIVLWFLSQLRVAASEETPERPRG